MANVMYAAALYMLSLLGVCAAFVLDTSNPYTPVQTVLLVVLEALPMALFAAIYLCTPQGGHMRSSLRLNNPGAAVLLIIPIAVVAYLAVNYVTSAWAYMWMLLGADPFSTSTLATPQNITQVLISLVSIAASPAIFEEFLFRGVMLPAFERKYRNFWTPIVLSGLLFAVMHGSTLGLPAHLMLGIVLGFVVVVTDSIWAGVLYHFLHNGLSMLISYISENTQALSFMGDSVEPATTAEMLGTIAVSLVLAVLFTGALVGLLYALKKIYSVRRKDESNTAQVIPMEPLGEKPTGIMKFLPWLPLLVAVPVIVLNYLASAVLMYMSSFMPMLDLF